MAQKRHETVQKSITILLIASQAINTTARGIKYPLINRKDEIYLHRRIFRQLKNANRCAAMRPSAA
jgi:hypothetical protein